MSAPEERIFSSAASRRWHDELHRAGPRYVLSSDTASGLADTVAGLFSSESANGPVDGRTGLLQGPYGAGKTLTLKLLSASLDPRGPQDAARVAARALSHRELAAQLDRARTELQPVVAWCGLLEPADISLHERIVGEVAAKLGFCALSTWVAEVEVQLERRGMFDAFESTAREQMKLSWSELRGQPHPEAVMARLLQAMPDAELKSAGLLRHRNAPTRQVAVKEAVDLVRAMFALRAPEAALVLALDDVQALERSDALRGDARRLVSHLAQSLKGRLYVLGTREAHGLGEATPAAIAHAWPMLLNASSIRETLRTLLPEAPIAASLDTEHGARAFDLALAITTELSARHAGRGSVAPPRLVEHIEHIARGRRGVASPSTVSPSGIVELASVAGPWLDPEVMATLEAWSDAPAQQRDVLRAIAVLELLPEDMPRTAELIRGCIAANGRDATDHAAAVHHALNELSDAGALSHSRLHGYKVETETGRAWLEMRDAVDVTSDETSEIVKEKLARLLQGAAPPELEGRKLDWKAKFADGRRAHDDPLFDRGHGDPIPLDLRHLPLNRRSSEEWERRSVRGPLFHRLIWIAQGDLDLVRDLSVDLAKARRMIARFSPVGTPLSDEHQRLLRIERDREQELSPRMTSAVEETFVAGTFFFRGTPTKASELGTRFATVLRAASERVLPDLLGISEAAIASAKEEPQIAVVTLPTGREVSEPAELDELLKQLDERVRPLLRKGVKVRLR